MLQTVDEDEKVVNTVYTLGGNQETWLLTEHGLYEVLMQSRKPIAKQFKKEVKKILKTLRQTGTYTLQQSQPKVPFTEIVQSIAIISKDLNINDASKLLMYDKLYSSYGVSTEFLPKYENNGSRELKSATELLDCKKTVFFITKNNFRNYFKKVLTFAYHYYILMVCKRRCIFG